MLFDSHKEAVELKVEMEKKKEKLEELARQTSLDTTLALLQTAAAQAEEDSENTASQFLDGELSLEAFLNQFIEQKKLAHLRRIKAEKLMDFVRQNMMAPTMTSNAAPIRPAPLPPYPSNSSSGYMPPYPLMPPVIPPSGYPHENPSFDSSFPFSRPNYR